jgi:plasmid stabilization system protein ParE
MAADLVVAAEAELDVADAYGWYEAGGSGWEKSFCRPWMHRSPTFGGIPANSAVRDEYRRCLVRRFPYAVFYEYSESTVTVYAVFHTSRNPDRWRERLS